MLYIFLTGMNITCLITLYSYYNFILFLPNQVFALWNMYLVFAPYFRVFFFKEFRGDQATTFSVVTIQDGDIGEEHVACWDPQKYRVLDREDERKSIVPLESRDEANCHVVVQDSTIAHITTLSVRYLVLPTVRIMARPFSATSKTNIERLGFNSSNIEEDEVPASRLAQFSHLGATSMASMWETDTMTGQSRRNA